MTTLVRGPIRLVTDRPDTVRKINLRAPELRLHGAGIVTDHSDDIPVVGGQVEFEALPGPAVLTLVTAGGAPLRSVDIVVPDEDTANLAECLDQIYVYDPPVVGRAQQFAREAGEFAARAEAGADRVGSAEQVGAWVGEAEVLRGDTVAAAEHAETQAGVATEQAGVAAGHAERAGADRVQTAEDRRQTGEDRAQTGEDREAAEGWAEQSKDAATLAITAAATVTQYVGDGFPEGKVSAPVGSIYTDRQATAGAVRWIKTQGTGNTGWEVEYGDTGWRDISENVLVPTSSGTRVFIRRAGIHVYLSADVLHFTDTVPATTPFLEIPSGFRAVTPYRTSGAYEAGAIYTARGGTNFSLREAQVGTSRFYASYLTDNPWPSTLPGPADDPEPEPDPEPGVIIEESPPGSGLYLPATGMTPDPDNPGLFIIQADSNLTEDPDNPGLYLIGD